MRESNIYGYYIFGYNYCVLRGGVEGKQVHGDPDSLIADLKAFFSNLDDFDLGVTKEAAADLLEIASELPRLPPTSKVDAPLAQRIIAAMNKLDTTLDSELKQRSAFTVTPKRFQLSHLLAGSSKLLAVGTWDAMTALTRFDFSSGCRSIAFELPTAAAFHLMRCVEGMLRDYYCAIVKRNRCDPLLWGPMIQHLRSRKKIQSPAALLDHLDHIRTNFRNPTQHPEARYDNDEAQDLLAVVIDSLNRMVRNLRAP
jgi:hypothetical protein